MRSFAVYAPQDDGLGLLRSVDLDVPHTILGMAVYPRQSSMWRRDGTRRQFFVYIMSNNSMTLYTGVTNDLQRRVWEHKQGEVGFTSRYHIRLLVYFECFELATDAIMREKAIKGLTRAKKIALIKRMNPTWKDLSSVPHAVEGSFPSS